MSSLAENKEPAVVLFSGEKKQDGTNWCPDCETISPQYKDYELECEENKIPFYIVIAGGRDQWNDPNNYFRKHKISRLKGIPTLAKWNGTAMLTRLEGMDIANKQLRAELMKE